MTSSLSAAHVMDKLMKDYKCAICLEIYIDAMATSCQHIFCRFCLSKWLQFSQKCPDCHKSVDCCSAAESIDQEVDALFIQLPSPLRTDREDVKQRRRNLENSSNTAQNCASNALQEKLRVQRQHSGATAASTNESSSITSRVSMDNNSFQIASTDRKENNHQLHLPRLVSGKMGDKVNDKSYSSSGNTSQYKNIKLPPINKTSSTGHRQSRGILTTTTACVPRLEDMLPEGMEGDVQMDLLAEENIRELERRNQVLEEQLFGAYDRIMDTIKLTNTEVVNNIDPNVFRISTSLNKQPALEPSFSKESLLLGSQREEKNKLQMEKRTNEVEDLLAETEELIEIEDFLKKFPFERIRDDDTLINYEEEDEEDDMNLSLLESDLLKDISEHRASKSRKPLTADQQAIENFYRKLESKQLKQNATNNNNSSVANPVLQQPRIPKSVTQQTSSSKMKTIPTLKKLELSNNKHAKSSDPLNLNNRSTKPPIKDKLQDLKIHRNIVQPPIMSNKHSSSTSASSKLIPNNSIPKPANVSTEINNRGTRTLTDAHYQQASRNNKGLKVANSSVQPECLETLKINDDFIEPSEDGLNYEDFLKLEIDFLDGDGDWKEFDKQPQKSVGKKSKIINRPTIVKKKPLLSKAPSKEEHKAVKIVDIETLWEFHPKM